MSDLLSRNVLVISQKPKFVEMTNEYAITDESGAALGAIRQEGQSKARKLLRLVTSVDQFLTTRLEVVDADGQVLLHLTRPAKIFKSRVVVADGNGRQIGTIVQENMIGKIRFGLLAGERSVGSINAENWRAWDFNICDHNGREVARVKKKWEGIVKNAGVEKQ